MSTSTQLTRILQRGRTASAWAALNEILLDREIGVITDSVPRQFKIGDGVTHWNDLALAFDNTGTANAAPGDTPSSSYKTYNVATAGTYTNFGGLVVSSGDLSSGLVQLRLNGSTWSKVIIPISLTAYAQKVDAILKADAINTGPAELVTSKTSGFWPASATVESTINASGTLSHTNAITAVQGDKIVFMGITSPTLALGTMIMYFDASGNKVGVTAGASLVADSSGLGYLLTVPAIATITHFGVNLDNTNTSTISIKKAATVLDTYDKLKPNYLPLPVTKVSQLTNDSGFAAVVATNRTNAVNFLTGIASIVGNVGSTGTIAGTAGWLRTDRVPVTAGKSYTFNADNFTLSGSKHMCFYDASNAFLSKLTLATTITLPFNFTVPAGATNYIQNLKEPADPATPSNLQLTSSDTASVPMATSLNGNPISATHIEDNPINRQFIQQFVSGTASMTYAALKSSIVASTLIIGQSLTITAFGAANATFKCTVKATNAVDENVHVLNGGYDFYKLDMTVDKIYAYDNIACIARNTAGTWGFVDFDTDASAHKKKGFSSLSAPSGSVLRATYTKTNYTKVVSLIASPDETYTLNGVAAGPSVGLQYADFNFSTYGLFGEVSEVSGTLTISTSNAGLQTPLKTASMNLTTGVITITHSALSFSGAQIMTMNAAHRPVLQPSGSGAIAFKMVDSSGATVLSPTGMQFQVFRSGVRTLLNSEMGIAGSNIWIQGLMLTEIV